ncbi:MAG: LysR family transcriptional regulator [Clostridia bacterium]|nr:LysR family transcriptional regulator [Clostridia bacterium]MBR4053264.1 LysR family transcriptional regulator [Clostridia bacterium]
MINKKIDYFLTLAECLNFTQAAAKHSVSQTAISQYIAALEEKLGIRLFKRSSHSVSLTEAGAFYYERVKFLRKYYEDTEKRVRAIDAEYSGYVKVGFGVYEYCNTEEFFGAFLKQFPAVKVDFFQYPYGELTAKLKTGELDVIVADSICEQALQKEEFHSRTLFESPNYLVAHSALAQKYAGGSPVDLLKGEYLITNCENSGPSSMDMLRRLLWDAFGFVPEKISQTNSIGAQLLMVRSRHGVAIVPGFMPEIAGEEFVKYPIPGNKIVQYNLMMLADNTNPIAKRIMSFDPNRKESVLK